MIQGSLVAIVTPMFEDGSLDVEGLRSLVDWHIAEGSDGIVIVGTTGESPTVSFDEHCQLIRVAVEQSAGRIPVIAGTGANSTSEAIELTRCAKAAGAQVGLSVVPYYNKPTQEGLYRHYKGDRRSGRPAADPLQRSRPHCRRPVQRHGAAPGAGSGHRRHQGCDRQHGACCRPVAPCAR
jgi:hypothetical protein